MKEIRGTAKTIRELLSGAKYSIDYYQREYKWETKQVVELIEDLSAKFLESYEPDHERGAVERYGHYFLGSIIISDKDGHKFIIDGQQRLTTLSLLLILVHNLQLERDDRVVVAELIFSEKYGKRSFNLDVPERLAAMEAIFNREPFDENGQPESVKNIVSRYRDIEDQFPEELTGEALPYFVDWFLENVHLVEITAYSDDDAYTIFETMNDRGLSLSPTDMLKGYLLANISDEDVKLRAAQVWKARVGNLLELGKEEDADGIKAWLRSQHAKSIRERKKGALPQDFDRIGTEFHRWIRDHREQLNLLRSEDFARFIEQEFAFYVRQYARLRHAAEQLTPGLEPIYYNAQLRFTLQYPVLLASLCPEDSDERIVRKLRVAARYLEILLARRVWNWRMIAYSTMQYAMFLVVKAIRRQSPETLSEVLKKRLDEDTETFGNNDRFSLTGMNGKYIHWLLARMTSWLETQSRQPSRYVEYMSKSGKRGYEVEHIWANHPERHLDEFQHPKDFAEYRNRIGGLLLLPKSFNASYGDLPFEEKREYYLRENLLAQSLHERCYEHNPGFRRLIERTGLDIQPHADFKKADLDARQELYCRLAEAVWNPDRLLEEEETT